MPGEFYCKLHCCLWLALFQIMMTSLFNQIIYGTEILELLKLMKMSKLLEFYKRFRV
jgi:hypothetical protein